MNDNETKTALQLIQKDLALPRSDLNLKEAPEIKELHSYLKQAISELLDKDFNRLLNALYRIDVSEKKVAEAIHLSDQEEIAGNLATLIIEREIQKVHTRMKYSSGKS